MFEEKMFLESKGLKGYKPHFTFQLEKGPYVIKLAETEEELIQTFLLRYEVYGQYYKTPPPVPLDIDDFDKNADHIIVINKKKGGRVVGTYRVLCSDFTSDFYTAREFNIDNVKNLNKKFVEMGRATVLDTARLGVVITLLWRGLGEFITKVQADYLFGCATLWTQDVADVVDVWKYFEQKDLFFSKKIFPLKKNEIPDWESMIDSKIKCSLSEDEMQRVGKLLPPLFRSYVKAGAKFGLKPANDVKLQSVDFFTICKVTDLSESLVKKYL